MIGEVNAILKHIYTFLCRLPLSNSAYVFDIDIFLLSGVDTPEMKSKCLATVTKVFGQ
tara:strand:- start:239 stop:412 length:174 start_codon:yes stop_codon:yes gene_type:complete